MTDLKRALRAFDDVSPDEAVLRRAEAGPTRPSPPGRPRGERVIAGVTAVAVFAIAGTFAWRVMRASDEPVPPNPAADVVELGSDGSTLWPQRTRIELVSAQSRTDTGGPGARWQLDPEELLDRFIETVLGWQPDTFTLGFDRSGEAEGRLVARLERTDETCPPFTQEDEDRGIGPCVPATEVLTLVQPVAVGEGGIWVVAGIRSPGITIDLVPGQVVVNGDSVEASVETGENLNAARAVVVRGEDDRNCGAFFGDDPERAEPELEVRIEPDASAGTVCGSQVPGYIVVATATWLVAGEGNNVANPLNADSSSYVSVAAIPFALTIPENRPAPGMNVYEDPLGGWKVDLPEPWYVAPVNDVAGERTLTISNEALPIEAETERGPDPSAFPADLVVLEITRLVGAPVPEEAGDDSTFPLDADRFPSSFQTTEAPVVAFQGNGLAYEARLFVGEDAVDEVVAQMLDVIRSLRFPSLLDGEVANGWVSVGRRGSYPVDRGTPSYTNLWGVIYVVRATGGVYVLDLEPESCGEGGNQTWDRERVQILYLCPFGPDIRYERDGTPVAGNPPGFTEPLDVYPAITAWDGTLLASVTKSIDDVDRYWPHA
jgi:hypothetical protein